MRGEGPCPASTYAAHLDAIGRMDGLRKSSFGDDTRDKCIRSLYPDLKYVDRYGKVDKIFVLTLNRAYLFMHRVLRRVWN